MGNGKHTVASISTVARAEVMVVDWVGGSGVMKHEHALLSWYELNEVRNRGTKTDRRSRSRLIGDG